jgi:protein gp37
MATKIEWTNLTWNPWWGCTEIAPECGFHFSGEGAVCYAALFGSRGLHARYRGVAAGGKWTGKILPAGDVVWQAPLSFPAGAKVFSCSMSDFWHEGVPLEWLDAALDMIERCPHLIFQILTKRPGNIARKLAALKRRLPPNVWIGVTIGHRQSLPLLKPLQRLEAPLKFLSDEPLLTSLLPGLDLSGISWVIGGGQSGRNALPCDPDHMRELRDLCGQSAGTAFFLKQWGTWESNPTPRDQELDPAAKGGATLDGRLWREFPRWSLAA